MFGLNEGAADNNDMEGDMDSGFDCESSEDDIVEELEERGVKRKISEREGDLNKKSRKKLKKFKEEDELHKPPTANELNRLRETENLYHSNLFRMQIEEMLKEVQVKPKWKKQFDSWFEKFSDWIYKVEDNPNKYDLSDQEWLKELQIKIPIKQVPYIVKGTYQFKKPSKVSIIGSYATDLVLGPKFVVDVLVELPQSFFQKEDYLNTRYHRKRALYLCELLHHIQMMPNLVQDVHFVAEEIDNLKPKIEITPFGKLGKYVKVVLHAALEPGTYKLSRFSPSKNNVRWKWYFKENTEGMETVPTPFYNSTIAADLVINENMTYLKEIVSIHKNIKDGIILLKIWLKQRELDGSVGSFNGFLISMLVCYLLQNKKINVLMSSYQVFRNVCNYLVQGCDWTTNGITLCSKGGDNFPTMTEFHENYKVVFVDGSGFHNLCYAMSPHIFKHVQHEAQLALKFLNDPNINSFHIIFITKVPFYQHHDHMVVFKSGESLENIADVYSSKEVQLSHCGITSLLVRDSVINLLNQGFGKRVKHIHSKLPSKNHWKIDKKPKRTITLTIGFNLDPNNYFSVVDKASETEMESFRQFWGTKSELRRFQDSSITEAVVWSGRTFSEKRLICKEILTYLLKSKFALETSDFQYIADQLDGYIGNNVEENSLKVAEAFDALMKQLRNLNELPLDVISVQGTSPVFRYTEVFPPFPQKQREGAQRSRNYKTYQTIKVDLNTSPPWICPVDVVIQMAASNKWPHDLEAIRRIRAAFNIKICESLSSQYGLTCEPFQERVELIKDGFVFRIRVVYPNEIGLLKQTVDTDGLIKYKDTEKSLKLEKESIHLPKLSSILHGLYQEYTAYGPACCLIKRWISAHLIDSFHMSEESIELLVASLFLRPQPHEPPQQPQVAFLRFLYLMTTTNWNAECIILNINEELTRQEIIEIESDFINNRPTLPSVFIATPYDRKKSVWTKDSPNPLILLRLIELCANALRVAEANIYSETLFEYKMFFKPCLDTYDVIISVKDGFNPRKKALIQKDWESPKDYLQKIPVNGFDPVSFYLDELRENYDDLALFFHDTYGGSKIAVIWKPNALETVDFKVPNLPARKYNSKTKKLELNKDAILEDFWHVGSSLVSKIEIKTDTGLKNFTPVNK